MANPGQLGVTLASGAHVQKSHSQVKQQYRSLPISSGAALLHLRVGSSASGAGVPATQL
jgi:hypothetical protein